MANHHFDVPRTIARVNNPSNESLFKHLGVDEIVSPTRMILGSIEADIPVHELLHLAVLGGGELELVEAQLRDGSPVVGQLAGNLQLPDGCSVFAIIRDERALSVRSDTELRVGDKVIGIGRTECESELHRILLGESETAI
jgi:trk system potassium uptake protein TrkA